MSRPHARWMNVAALSLLVTALIVFVAFHFMVVDYASSPMGKNTMGWHLWPELYRFVRMGNFSDSESTIAATCFLCATLLVALAPFSISFLQKSRLAWWVVVIPAGVATFGFGGTIGIELLNSPASFGPGIPCLIASFALNFTGLLLIRREPTPEPVVDAPT
ncbi:hypothetical protein OKA04_01500 [Luteolibacter flavescens]|uniref:Uncharacterized protein n=1 Tax=Luteolibacter flavescens TaxID=1859460 RepID=A0ABT3FIM1_9BACT|nr:hypothetical protein [Luteolibacter flavescens]MCW1883385.1 hypothetical protein [Luteolibacter flavescens]